VNLATLQMNTLREYAKVLSGVRDLEDLLGADGNDIQVGNV
jgi:hypothetical protein